MPVLTRSAYIVRRNAINGRQILSEKCRLEQMCAICHDDIRGSDVYHLPCGHTFHKNCLIQQLQHGRQWATKCAVCRREHRDAILQNSELSQYINTIVHSDDFILTMTLTLPPMIWNTDESAVQSAQVLISYLTEGGLMAYYEE